MVCTEGLYSGDRFNTVVKLPGMMPILWRIHCFPRWENIDLAIEEANSIYPYYNQTDLSNLLNAGFKGDYSLCSYTSSLFELTTWKFDIIPCSDNPTIVKVRNRKKRLDDFSFYWTAIE